MSLKEAISGYMKHFESSFESSEELYHRYEVVLDGTQWVVIEEWNKVPTMTPYFEGKFRYPLREVTKNLGFGEDFKLFLHVLIDSGRGTSMWLGCDPQEALDLEYYPVFFGKLLDEKGVVLGRGHSPEINLAVGAPSWWCLPLVLVNLRNPEQLRALKLRLRIDISPYLKDDD